MKEATHTYHDKTFDAGLGPIRLFLCLRPVWKVERMNGRNRKQTWVCTKSKHDGEGVTFVSNKGIRNYSQWKSHIVESKPNSVIKPKQNVMLSKGVRKKNRNKM